MIGHRQVADEFAEPRLDGGLSPGIARAIERMLAQHEPFPMTVLDRGYNVLRTNAGATRLLGRFVAMEGWQKAQSYFDGTTAPQISLALSMTEPVR